MVGRQVIGVVGTSLQLRATGHQDDQWKVGGITIDWALVTAVSGADVVLPGGTTVKIGQKYIPVGTFMCKLTSGATAGYYAPYNSAGTHGEQTPTWEGGLTNEDILQTPPFGLYTAADTDHIGVLQAGTVWLARLKAGGAGQPSLATLQAALPGIRPATM